MPRLHVPSVHTAVFFGTLPGTLRENARRVTMARIRVRVALAREKEGFSVVVS